MSVLKAISLTRKTVDSDIEEIFQSEGTCMGRKASIRHPLNRSERDELA